MAFLPVIPPDRATGELRQAYDEMAALAGNERVAQIVQTFSLRPSSMRRMIRCWELTMWTGSEPRARRELVASLVSRLNDCHY